MVKLLTVLFLCSYVYCMGQPIPSPTKIASDHIRIDHAGPNDKPFGSLVITTRHLYLQVGEIELLVDEAVFSVVLKTIEGSDLINSSMPEKREFGIFKFLVKINGKTADYFSGRRTDSVLFFKDLKGKVIGEQTSKGLVQQINELLSRIDVKTQ